KGVMIKKLHKSVRWSARRVGTRVKYSRKARKERRPKNIKVPIRPTRSVRAKIAHMIHQARIRALRFWIAARDESDFAARRSAAPMTLARTSRTRMPQNSRASCESLRSGPLKPSLHGEACRRLPEPARGRASWSRPRGDEWAGQTHGKYRAVR